MQSLQFYSPAERSAWREHCDDIASFSAFAAFDTQTASNIAASYSLHSLHIPGLSVKDWVVRTADTELYSLKLRLDQMQGNRDINWALLRTANTGDKDVDNSVFVWMALAKETTIPFPAFQVESVLPTFAVALRKLLWSSPDSSAPDIDRRVSRAFFATEKPDAQGVYPSRFICDRVVGFYRQYLDSATYLAPYTSIVGPSGIGKSFAVKQMAILYGYYVCYTSFAKHGSTAYPRRSLVANTVPVDGNQDRPRLVRFWTCFLVASMGYALACRQAGITPTGFFHLQTDQDLSHYQNRFSDIIRNLFNQSSSNSEPAHLKQAAEQLFTNWITQAKVALDSKSLNRPCSITTPLNTPGIPDVVFCLDEARALVDDPKALIFRSFRQAAREHMSECRRNSTGFFAVLLDTASRVSNFTPEKSRDPSQKQHNYTNILPPIYQLKTWDVAVQTTNLLPDGSQAALEQLFRHGRPLWGALLDERMAYQDVVDLAMQKISGCETVSDLALLSYRVNFYASRPSIAEDLVAGYLRYIIQMSPERDFLVTSQPGEPILAHAAFRLMRPSHIRLRVVKTFAQQLHQGAINIGDVGEMVASLLLLFAADQVQDTETPRAFQLRTFLEALFKQDLVSQIATLDSPIWNEAQVFFNHFVKVYRHPDEAMVLSAFIKGQALVLPDRFPGGDLVIPIWLPGSSTITCFIIQVKNRKGDSMTDGLILEASTSVKNALNAMPFQKRPQHYLGLLLCLRHGNGLEEYQFQEVSQKQDPGSIILAAVGLHQNLYGDFLAYGGILPHLRRLVAIADGPILPKNDPCPEYAATMLDPFYIPKRDGVADDDMVVE